MIKLQNILTPVADSSNPLDRISTILKINSAKIKSVKLFRRSIDARKKTEIFYCDTFLVNFNDSHIEKKILKNNKNASVFVEKPYVWKKSNIPPAQRPIIIGSGPAGLFAALTLAKAGIAPIIIERGEAVDDRIKSVESFWSVGKLNPNSNVQFGEGGAGTFSDGKLNTGIKDSRCRTVLEIFNKFGADDDILINAKPHIGTDVLRKVVKNIRKEIIDLGGEYRFNTEFIKPIIKNKQICSVVLKDQNGEYELPCDALILAIGNAARNTYKSLWQAGMNIIPKPFAIGVRIEHLQYHINSARYGDKYRDISVADYKLATHLNNGRGVYTFCMCPGGVVVNSASEPSTYVTNGMSYKARDGINANSALLVGVDERDFAHLSDGTPFGGVRLQEQIEQKAYKVTGGKGVPVQTLGSFLNGEKNEIKSVNPTVKSNYYLCDLNEVFPDYIIDSLKEALPIFNKQINGFANNDAVLTAPETRSSSPVKIVRNENYCSDIKGIYPAGEGAGYAGGITSSAVDGMRVAEALIDHLNRLK